MGDRNFQKNWNRGAAEILVAECTPPPAGVGTGHPKLSCILFVCCLQAKENAVQSGRALPEVWLMVLHPASDHEWSMCDQPNFMQCLETAKF